MAIEDRDRVLQEAREHEAHAKQKFSSIALEEMKQETGIGHDDDDQSSDLSEAEGEEDDEVTVVPLASPSSQISLAHLKLVSSSSLSLFTEQNSYSRLFATAKKAIKTNFVPGLFLNAFALLIVILFYLSPPVNDAFASLADFKSRWDLLFSFVSTLVVGGLVPWLLLYWTESRKNEKLRLLGQTIPKRVPNIFAELVFLCLLWGEKGMEVDLFYQLQALVFGSQATAPVVIVKVLVDQFIYNPLWASHTVLGAYFWKDANFTWGPVYAKFASRDYWNFIWPSSLISTWVVWIPAVSIIYSLPSPLQIPLFDIVLCFWSILLQIITKAETKVEGLESPIASKDNAKLDALPVNLSILGEEAS